MNVASRNNLWIYLSNLSLTTKDKQWLSQKLLESTKEDKAHSKAEEALRQLDGCWAHEDMDDSLECDIENIRSMNARKL